MFVKFSKNQKIKRPEQRLPTRKRLPTKPFSRENDFYVTNKSDFKAQLKRCQEILDSGAGTVYLHCIGNSINRGINLAYKLGGTCGIECNTSTITLLDDVHPLNDIEDFTIQKRLNSCLHIRVFRLIGNSFQPDVRITS